MKSLTDLRTDKDVFDYVSSFLLNQNKRSSIDDIGCAYRGYNGEKCAIGCIIADEFYQSKFESQSVYDLDIQSAIANSLPNYSLNDYFLNKLQSLHDSVEVNLWEVNLSRFQFSIDGAFELVNENSFTNEKGEIQWQLS